MGTVFSRMRRSKANTKSNLKARSQALPPVPELPPPYREFRSGTSLQSIEKTGPIVRSIPQAIAESRSRVLVQPLPPTPAPRIIPAPLVSKTCFLTEPWLCVPLIDIAYAGFREVAEVLVDGGADIEARNACGQTALYAAARNGHLDIVQFLHQRGARLDIRTHKFSTPLYSAARFGHLGVVEYLLAHDVPPDQPEREAALANRSPLSIAVKKGHLEIAEALLAAGASTEAASVKTPLYHACRANDPELVKVLLKGGADPNEKTWDLSRGHRSHSITIADCGRENSRACDPRSMFGE